MIRVAPFVFALGLMAGVAHAQERAWTLDASDEDAYLIFGVPESDDVGVSLWCPIGKGVVNLYLPVPTAELARLAEATKESAAPLTITAGSETATFRGKADINRAAAVSSLEVEIEVQHPLVAAFTTADRFTVTSGETQIVFPLYEADVEGLLELCRKG